MATSPLFILVSFLLLTLAQAQSSSNDTVSDTTNAVESVNKPRKDSQNVSVKASIKPSTSVQVTTTQKPKSKASQVQKSKQLKQKKNSDIRTSPEPSKTEYNAVPLSPYHNLALSGPSEFGFYLDNGRRYEVQQTALQSPSSQPLDTALGAISAHLLTRPAHEYIPFPPNDNPAHYHAYRGNAFATEPPLIASYDKANQAGYTYYAGGKQPTAKQIVPQQPYYPPSQPQSRQLPLPNPYFGFGNPGSFFHEFYPEPYPFFPNHRAEFPGRKEEVESTGRSDNKEPIKRHAR